MKFKVVDGSNQVEAQIEALTSIAITITQNAENLQSADNMFTENALTGKITIRRFLFSREWMKFRFLCRDLTVGM